MNIIAALLIMAALVCFVIDCFRTGFSLVSLGLAFTAAFLLVFFAIPAIN